MSIVRSPQKVSFFIQTPPCKWETNFTFEINYEEKEKIFTEIYSLSLSLFFYLLCRGLPPTGIARLSSKLRFEELVHKESKLVELGIPRATVTNRKFAKISRITSIVSLTTLNIALVETIALCVILRTIVSHVLPL